MKIARIRIAVAVTDDGAWISNGNANLEELQEVVGHEFNPPVEFHFIEAEIPAPESIQTHPATPRRAA